ncbi:hypothetical protein F5B22DRAFT_444332 [Xylaria bambusicola]|uniref:uncharacterized protein n=1 Tax=Xylaria bambusicola TaxID=326684 RepID=UPI002007C4E8|nr:uncharacterized protein F5B22DRAFT_444332 [Xylaria bambusicola]KAI0506634.1 hypothetical protein F5B22DRAFT_444332 [Xylaria bambusicola]
MSAFITRLSLFWAALFSLLSAVAARGPPQYPTTLEVDIVFPRNDTYAPVDAFPLVIAIQNNWLSQYLVFGLFVSWAIFNEDNQSTSSFVDTGIFMTEEPAYEDQRYLVSATTQLNSTEGQFLFYAYLDVNNCSTADVNANGTYNGDTPSIKYIGSTYFTLQNTTQLPDLVAATSPDTCASIAALLLNITGYTPRPGVSPIPGLSPEEQKQCPVIGNATASPTPCSVRLNQTQAASISASATAIACGVWPTDYPGYKAACEAEPESVACQE